MSQIRLRLDSGPTLRVEQAGSDANSARLVAELPWLRVGTNAELELEDGARKGCIDWIGLEPSADGIARLTLRVSFDRPRPEATLPYFSTREMAGLRVEQAPVRELVEEARTRRSALAWWRVGLASIALATLLGLAFSAR